MNLKKKVLSIVLSVLIMNMTVCQTRAEASWFSNFFGGLFTLITSPLLLICPDNPTLRKNNPFRKKLWEEEAEREEEISRYRKITDKKFNELEREIKEEAKKQAVAKEAIYLKIQHIIWSINEFNTLIQNQEKEIEAKLQPMKNELNSYQETIDEVREFITSFTNRMTINEENILIIQDELPLIIKTISELHTKVYQIIQDELPLIIKTISELHTKVYQIINKLNNNNNNDVMVVQFLHQIKCVLEGLLEWSGVPKPVIWLGKNVIGAATNVPMWLKNLKSETNQTELFQIIDSSRKLLGEDTPYYQYYQN
jgi:hypothetical protein